MLNLADIHTGSGRLAVRRSDPDGKLWLELRTLAGQVLGEIPHEFLPLMPHWSPDGSSVAFGTNDGRLCLYRLGEAVPQVIFSRPGFQAGFCEWAADGNRLVFSAYSPAAQLRPTIFTLDVHTGRTLQLTNDPRMVDRFPHWSPSGQWVSFLRQDLDEPEIPRRVYVLDLQSGRCFPILNTADVNCHTGRHAWRADSSAVLVTHVRNDAVEIRVVRPLDQSTTWRYESKTLQDGVFPPSGDGILCIGTDELLWFEYPGGTLKHRLSLASLSPVRLYFSGPQIGFDQDPSIVYFLSENACLYRWTLGGDCVCMLQDHPQPRPDYSHEAYTVLARDGRPIPVQRFIPPHAKSPAILYVHGGPNEAINPDDPFMLRLLAEGVEFVCVAYRGSSGYGPEHEEANRGECGRADVWDVVAAGLDWKNRTGNSRPLLIAGYSYGGFLTLLALAQADNPWSGGIVLWAVSGLHRQGALQHRAFPADPAQRAEALIKRSPLAQAERIRCPLLIFHGALDPMATTEEMQAIRGRVVAAGGSCELIVYDDGDHGLHRHGDDIHARVLEFVERFR